MEDANEKENGTISSSVPLDVTSDVSPKENSSCSTEIASSNITTAIYTRHISEGKHIINQYAIQWTIGKGTFCSVKYCVATSGVYKGRAFGMKVYRKSDLTRKRDFRTDAVTRLPKIHTRLEQVYHEIQILLQLHHPRCLQCYEIIESEQNDGKLCIVMDYMACGAIMYPSNGKYCSRLSDQSVFSEDVAKCIIKDASEGLAYLHNELEVAHRDIKPGNLLMDSTGRVKIGDFGLSEKMDVNGRVRSTKGTYYFMSPECLEIPKEGTTYEGHNGRAADMWGLGVTLWAMLFGDLYATGDSLQDLFDNILYSELKWPSTRKIHPQAESLLSSLLYKSVECRITAQEVLKHPWILSADYSAAKEYATALLAQIENSHI